MHAGIRTAPAYPPGRGASFATRFPGVRRWVNRAASWLYEDPQGRVLGRVDVICDEAGRPWYWWQTAVETSQGADLMAAMRAVERALARIR